MSPFNFETTLLPLVLLILLGWLVGRAQDIDLKSISSVLIFAITPTVGLISTAQMSFHGTLVLLPVISCAMAAFCGLASFAIGQRLLRDKDMGYLLPQATGSGNNGYYGVPLAMALLPPDQVGVYFLIMLGVTLFEVTFGYYFVGRGHLTVRHALQRVWRMPSIYAIGAGLLISAMDIQLSSGLLKLGEVTRGCYVSIGMMIIGIALSKHKRLAWEWDFIGITMFGKYVLWAVVVVAFVAFDSHVSKMFDAYIYTMLAILVITPAAANTAAFAAQHNFKPQLAATVVFATTIVSFVALPVVMPYMLTFLRQE
jgi:predicted permease